MIKTYELKDHEKALNIVKLTFSCSEETEGFVDKMLFRKSKKYSVVVFYHIENTVHMTGNLFYSHGVSVHPLLWSIFNNLIKINGIKEFYEKGGKMK